MTLQGKVALVTGGASGIGLECVKVMLEKGVKHVAILEINQTAGSAVAKELNEQFGDGRVIFITCDVSKQEELEAAYKKTIETFKKLHIVANVAGILEERQYELAIAVNFTALVRSTFLALDSMGKDKGGEGGVIINIASIGGLKAMPNLPIYAAIKAAVVSFSQSLGLPFHEERTGVRVLTLCPGATTTPMTESSKLHRQQNVWSANVEKSSEHHIRQKPECVASAMVHLLENAKSGSVWVAEHSEPPYEIKFPHYKMLKV